MNFRFYYIWLALLSTWGAAQAAGNSAWNCEQSPSGVWTCLNQDTTLSPPTPPPVVKSPSVQTGSSPIEPNVSPTAVDPGLVVTPPTPPATLLVKPAFNQPVIETPAASVQPALTNNPLPATASPVAPTPITAQPNQNTPAESAVANTKPRETPPKAQVRITQNQQPHLQKVEPIPEQVSSTPKQPGWTCQSGSEQQNWNCNLVGADPKGEAQPVAGAQNGSYFLPPAFTSSQESTFQMLRASYPTDPWENCQNWAIKKRKVTSPNIDRENAITDVNADFSESFQGEVLSFSGNVDLTRADQHLLAEKASYDTSAGTMDAQGHVIYTENSVALASESLAMNLNTDEARIRQALFVSGDGPIRGYAEAIYRDNAFLSRYNDTAFTSCAPGHQDWVIHASRLKINRDSGQGSAKDAWLEFKGTPILYTPYISFPTDSRRLSGFLSPTWGSTQRAGFYVAAPFYWNIAPNVDSTITPRYFSGRGEMLTDQLRYLTDISKGTLGAEYMPNDRVLGKPRYSFEIKDNTIFNSTLKSQVDLNLVSDKTYFNDLNNALGFQRSSYLPSKANINYLSGDYAFTAGMQHYQSVDPTILGSTLPYDVLPRIDFNALHNFDGMPLRVGMTTQYTNFSHQYLVNGQRLMLWPSISTPYESTAGYIIPKLSVQSTQYELSNMSVSGTPTSINRTLPIFSLDSGLSFEKTMDFDNTAYNNIIEPRLFYLYIPRKNQSAIPIFDSSAYDINFNSLFRENSYSGYDRLQDANQVTLAATSRYVDSRTGLEPVKASFGEIVYFQNRTVTLNSTTTSINQLAQVPIPVQTSKTSNLIADLSGQINPHLNYVTGAQWNTERNSFARGQVGLKYRDQPDRIFDIAYRYRSASANPLVAPSVVPGTTNIPANISLTDVSFRWPIYDDWYALGRWQYSLNFNKTLESFIGLEKENCCWRVRIIGRRYINGATTNSTGITSNLTPETAFFVQLELKGLSGFGDDVDTFLQTSLNGYRKAGNY